MSGTSTTSAHPSNAETIAALSFRSPRSIRPARSGTTTAARIPPAAISKTTLGIVFVLWYAVPTTVAPTAHEKTSIRANPAIRAAMVAAAMIRADPPICLAPIWLTRAPRRRVRAARASS